MKTNSKAHELLRYIARFARPGQRKTGNDWSAPDEVVNPTAGWIAVDLDGTLAHYDREAGPEHIGAPVPAMAMRVRTWLSEGRDVRIFTARASIPELIEPVKDWCAQHFGVRLPVTNAKDFGMIELWDDRCIQVHVNTGQRVVNP